MSALTFSSDEERIPDLEIAQKKFLLTLPEYRDDHKAKFQLLEIIRLQNMAPWYESICKELSWTCDDDLLAEMKSNNEEMLNELDESIQEAQKVSSTIEVKEAFLKKANYLIKIGDKEHAVSVMAQAFDLTVGLGYKVDNIFTCIRVGFFYLDHDLITRNLERAEEMVEMGLDYDRRNRLRVYQGFYDLAIRNFKSATNNFLGIISTFTCAELMDYTTFIRYTVYAAIFTLPRRELEEKVIKAPDVLEVLYRAPDVQQYLFSLYQCEYAKFFKSLADVEEVFRKDYILNPHYRFYVREMRILAYSQLLASYKSLTLSYMAEQFEVTPEFIENELSTFIADRKIYGKIDKVRGIVIVNQDAATRKNDLYKDLVRKGDLLLNRVQNLSRFLDNHN